MDSIKIRKDVVIPGTNIILEAGDVIRHKVNEFVTAEDRYDVDVIENKTFGNVDCFFISYKVKRSSVPQGCKYAVHKKLGNKVEFQLHLRGFWTIIVVGEVSDSDISFVHDEVYNALRQFTGKTISNKFVRASEFTESKESVLTVKESNQVPAIAQVVTPAANSNITSVVRKDSIFNTCVAMGLPTKVNAMKNVVCSVKDMQEAAALLQTIYAQFGVKGSFMITWEGNGKVYFDPRTPVDTKMQIAYAKAHNLALPSTDPKKYIGY